MRESQIEARLGKLVRSMDGLYFKFVSPGNPGVPDRILVLPGGRVIFVELKTDVGRLSALQKWQRSEIQKRGADVRVLKGMDEVLQFSEEVMPHEVHSARVPKIRD